MAYGILLGFHIAGAVATLAVSIYAMSSVLSGSSSMYERVVIVLSTLAGFELITGVVLAAISREVTVISVCDNIGLYLMFVAGIETALFTRMKKLSLRFPVWETLSSIGGGVALLLVGALLGL